MGEHGDHVSTFEDWGAPSPSPRTFFSSILAHDMNTTSMLENNSMSFPRSSEGNLSSINDDNDESNGRITGGEFTRLDMYSQQKMNSRGGLVERMAARTGFSAPKINTVGVRPTAFSQNQDARSPYLTIPPGLSPTTLLESPVFLSNALAQPSPTTGKFPFTFGGFDTRSLSSDQDKNRDNLYGDNNASSFAFKPVPNFGPSSFLDSTGNLISNFPGFEVSKGIVVSSENSSPLDGQQDEEDNQPSGGDPLPGVTAPAEDGYNWRKYGQKQVKGSEYPRSYYKCTHPNCPVKKKVERSHEGHITEIIYKGAHSHPKPPPSRRSGVSMLSDTQADSVEVTSSETVEAENLLKSEDVVDDVEEDDRVTHGSVSLGCDGEEDESESKRRKIEAYAADTSGGLRAIREPRVVVQTTSEVDILDDGYRWRKYGQKVVKGNPNPRSYYKCTHTGCAVRKHVERASHDLKSVITTYEGKHNHEVPAARNNNSHLSNTTNGSAHLPAHLQRPDTAHLHNAMARFDNRNNPAMGSYGRQQQQQQQLEPNHGFSFGMGQPGFANLGMAGLGPGHTYMGQQQNYNEMGFMLPKGEPKVEPFAEASMNHQNGSSGYQMMGSLPLGP